MPEERPTLHKLLRKLLLGEPSPQEPEELENGDKTLGTGLRAKIEDEVGYVQGKEKKERSPDHPE